MKLPKWNRTWIPGIVFWILFLVSLALGERFSWIGPLWNAAWMLLLLGIGVYSVIHIFRNRRANDGFVGYRGVPRWVVTLFGDEVDPARKSTKRSAE